VFLAQPPADHRANGTEGDYWFSSARAGLEFAARQTNDPDAIGVCGPPVALAQHNWPWDPPLALTATVDDARVVYAAPREFYCNLTRIRELEAQRRVLLRVERGGGLVYEVLGPRDGAAHPVLTGESVYTQPGWYQR
jgi:hypothetical protein